MKDAAVPQQRPVHVGRREHHVRARLAVKRKASVALRRQLHKGQRRGIFPRHTQTAHVHCEYSCRMRNPERQGLKDLKRLEMA